MPSFPVSVFRPQEPLIIQAVSSSNWTITAGMEIGIHIPQERKQASVFLPYQRSSQVTKNLFYFHQVKFPKFLYCSPKNDQGVATVQ